MGLSRLRRAGLVQKGGVVVGFAQRGKFSYIHLSFMGFAK